jgi:zinc-ribbon domain
MTYTYDLDNGQRLLVENDGDSTFVALSSGDEGQQQSQSSGFDTGKWSKPPELFRSRGNLVLRLESKGGAKFLRVRGNQIQSMNAEPDLESADKLRLKKSNESVAMRPMEPMKPMSPMEPMKPMGGMRPMEPMRPMGSMRPMEMRMGDMQMNMGTREKEAEVREKEPEATKKFCTQCGKPARIDDRFCGNCGQELPVQK